MADIEDKEAIRFCEFRARKAADKLAQAYYFCKLVSQEWAGTNMATLIEDNAGSEVLDGAANDGRHRISGADVHDIIDRVNDMITNYEASGGVKLATILRAATKPLIS